MKNPHHTQKTRTQIIARTIPSRAWTGIGGKRFPGMGHLTIRVACFLIIAALSAWSVSRGQDAPQITAAEARNIIADGNRRWGKARVAFDKETFEKMLAPEFYVQLANRRLTRQEFIDIISTPSREARLSRFDATVLTVRSTDDGWVAVIHEKLERETPNGRVYSLWITRDGWKKVDDRWVITFSEAIGSEHWRGGEKPPFLDW